MKKKHLIYAILPALALALLIGGVARAATISANANNPFSKIASAIAQKFNLNADDVQKVINEVKTADRMKVAKKRL
ncbi:hypothetical protein KKA13_01550 [Patescibacteria group bacterium]|nr:hypothetical protein [Patescibacteria group bacterium]MBU1613428.1 hypothetical protein [Patescibacteria group bacterium]